MRNLEIVKSLILPPCSFLESPEAFSVDVDTGDIWIVDKEGLFSISSSASKRSVEPVVSIVDSGLLPEGADIIGLQHVPDMEIVCMAVSTGEVLTFSTATNELDCAGTLDNGITSMAWSPDQEVVLFTSGTGKIVLMNKEFDPIIEVNMHSTEFGESKPVTVGWGKKETQFHGSLGKQSAAKKKEDALPCFSWDDQKVGVCWRGDGQFFVVSSVSPATGNRILRVWTRECTLHSTSEEVVGMEQALYWRPTGNLMATSQRKPNKHDIIFFEPNGLRHGEFSLPCDRMEMKVKDLMWNADSSVLAVILENLSQKELETYNEQHGRILPCTVPEQIVQKSRVQLWYMSNYHWYLKQELRFDEGAGSSDGCTRLAQILWDPILPYKLHILTAEGRYMCYEWRWTVSRNRVLSPENTACVAVADGDQLLLTPFRRCVVPPPMSAHQLSLSSPVSCVTFGPLESPNDMLVVTSDGDIGWYSHQPNRESPDNTERDGEGFRNIASGPRLLAAGKLPRAAHLGCKETSGSLSVLSARHFCWWEKSTLLCVAWDADLHQDSILFYTLQVEEQEGSKLGRISLTQRKCFACDRSVLSMATNPHTKTVVAQFDDGTIWRVDPEAGLREWFEGTGLSLSFPQLCSLIELGSFGGEEVVVGLTDRHRLFFNDREIAADCMSFCFHDDFFLFTTHSHTCRVIGLHTPLKDIPRMTGEKTAMFDESLRRVERGSKIVTAVPSDTKVILQMPRGNLETIHPRALVLSCVRKGLDKLEFKKVFQLMKKHRINMNITVDHNPQVFFANIGLFVSQLDDTTAINLFLTELREENITETMYKGLGASGGSVQTGSKETGSNQLGSKVDRVCDAMIAELTQQGRSRFLLSIVTAHVKKSKPEMEAALLRIKHVKDHPPSPPSGGSTADEALKYLLYLVDVNELYNVALGMYDFDLVLFVAERSQKDPKEYLPYLNHLRKMDSCYMRYNIDKKLGRFKKALEHIVACGAEKFDECLLLIKEHSLYMEGLRLLKDEKDLYNTVSRAYGDHLLENRKFEDAGIAYMRADSLPEAKIAFENGLHWRKVFVLLAQMSASEAVVIETARKMADNLRSRKRHTEASRVLEEYAKDSEEAIVVLVEAWQWAESLRMIHFYKREDLIDSHFLPALKTTCNSVCDTLAGIESQLDQQTARLLVVRENKRKQQEMLVGADEPADDVANELFSEASSVVGTSVRSTAISTASSSRTAKSRRKADRKKYSLKEGSRYEDIGLMQALSDAVTTLDKYQDDVKELLMHLVLFKCDKEAESLQKIFELVLKLAEEKIPVIWVPDVDEIQNSVSWKPQSFGPESTVNSILGTGTKGIQKIAAPPKEGAQDVEHPKKPAIRKDVPWRSKFFLSA